jgi:putative intracellular protease/amidase
MLRVGLLVPPSFANLSFASLAVFDAANLMLGEVYYEQHVVSVSGGSVTNSFGMAVQTERAEDVPLDTLLVGAPPDARKPAPDIVEYLQSSNGKTRRLASICVAAFILGEAGLLDGRRSTSHLPWSSVILGPRRRAKLRGRWSCTIAEQAVSPNTRLFWRSTQSLIGFRMRFSTPGVTCPNPCLLKSWRKRPA